MANLAYVAANYFIEVLFRSPNLTINFDNLKMFRKLIGKEVSPAVAEYLDKESQDDFLFIFRKFPDVFLLKPDVITFTDTFTFLDNHQDSYEFNFNGDRDIRTVLYLENFAVSYFTQCLKSLGPQHYLMLFAMIVNDKTNKFCLYFQLHNAYDAQIFFEAHADVFFLCDNMVSLRKDKLLLTNLLLSKTLAPNIMVVFEDSVYFLLTCFKSLHYIEVRQCVCYAFTSVKNVLNRFPVIKQRELFEILPHLNMTKLGYLSLKHMDVNISITSLDRTILFIVLLLAVKQPMHYKDIEKEINRKLPPTSNCLKGFTKAALLQFFNNFSALFNISQGYITLQKTFIFPVFTTEILIPQNDNDTSKPVAISESDHSTSTSKTATANSDAKSMDDNENSQLQAMPSVQNDNLSTIDNNCKYFLYTLMLSESINKQIRLSILFLMKYFHPVDKQCVLITLFYVVEEVHNAFCSLSTSDRRSFISYCCQFINALSHHISEDCIAATMFEFEGMEKEFLLLFITYPLTCEKEMHFQKIVKSLEEKKINNPIASLSVFEQARYFQEMKKYLKMGSDGCVSLAPPYELIKKNVDTYTGFLSEKCCTDNSEMLKVTRRKEKVSEAEISATVSFILNYSSPVTGRKVPLEVRKTLLTAHHLCKKIVPYACLRRIFEASVFILEDLRKYVYNLSVDEQNDFVNECHKFMLNAKNFKKALMQDIFHVMEISTQEKENLLIAYFVSGRHTNNHIHGIMDKLKKHGIFKSLTSKNYEDQFKYFEETSQYFIISCDGYVTLHPSFNYLNSISENFFFQRQRIRGKARYLNQNPIEYQIKHIKVPVENDRVINSSTSEAIVKTDNDVEINNTIIDLCVFILSSTKKIPVEKLCHRVNTCKVPAIEDFFSFFSVYEKAKFFKDLSEYFEVTPDNFVSLKENVIDSYVPKTNLDHLSKNNSDYKGMPERSSSTSDSAVFSDVSESEFSESSSESSNNLRRKNQQVKKKSQSMPNKEKNAAKGKAERKSISMPHGLNNNIVESKIIWNSSIKYDPFRNISASISKRDVPSNALKSEKSAGVSKAFESVTVNSEQSCKKIHLSQKSCDGEDVNSTSFRSDIASSCSNLQVTSVINETSDPSTKSISEINSVCTIQKDNLSETEGTKISRAESKLAYETFYVSKQKSSHQTVSCYKKLSTQREEKYTEFDEDHTYNASDSIKKSSKQNHYSDYSSISNNKYNPSNKIAISDKETKALLLSASSSEVPSKPKHTKDLSAEIASNIHCAPTYKSWKVGMPSQKSCDEMYLPTTTESNKTFNNEQSTKACYPYIRTSNKLRIQNNCNVSSNGVSYSSSIECYTSNHIVDPKNSSVKFCSGFTKASPSEESKSLLDSPNISSLAVKDDCQIAKAVKSNCGGLKTQNSNHSEKSSIVPEQIAIKLKKYNCDSIQEMRAVNFFCVILGNYQKYNCGVSAEFLNKQLHQATDEVQSVIRDSYKNDLLSFFKKHKSEFYVSPQSQDVYLQKKEVIKC